MPIDVVPNRIEQSDFTLGYMPDGEEASVPATASPEMLNMLPDPATGAVELRKGYTRIKRISTLNGYWIRHLNYYEYISSGARKRNLVAILSNGAAAVNNVQVWVYSFDADTFTRVDTAGRQWNKPKAEHWFAVIQGTYYGGVRGDLMYSYDGATSTWDADPSTPNPKTWVDGVDAAINTDTQYGRDFAFKKGTQVLYSGDYYVTIRSIRYDKWENSEYYKKGDKVSYFGAWGQAGTPRYWKSFECIAAHVSNSGVNDPVTDYGTSAFWKVERLPNILNDDSEINTKSWAFLNTAAQTSIGVYHGSRLWLRRDDEDDWSRLQYSAPLRPERDAAIADLTFDPTDWAPEDDLDGDGGGWLPVYGNDGDAIRALASYGNMLIIAKRWASYVLVGVNEQTWILRRLGDFGAMGPQAIVEHAGLVYTLSPSGVLAVTDGTAQRPVPGAEAIREHIKARLDHLLLGEDDRNWPATIFSYGPFVGITLPKNPDQSALTPANETIFYHPELRSFWVTDLPILDATVGAHTRAQRLFFCTPITTGDPVVFQYSDNPGAEAWTDDDPQGGADTVTTAITWKFRTAWFKFGAHRAERRIRRAWVLLKGAASSTVTAALFRNYEETTTETTRNVTLADGDMAEYVEPLIAMNAAYSIGVKASGTASAELVLHAVGIDTEPVRTRFHRN